MGNINESGEKRQFPNFPLGNYRRYTGRKGRYGMYIKRSCTELLLSDPSKVMRVYAFGSGMEWFENKAAHNIKVYLYFWRCQ